MSVLAKAHDEKQTDLGSCRPAAVDGFRRGPWLASPCPST